MKKTLGTLSAFLLFPFATQASCGMDHSDEHAMACPAPVHAESMNYHNEGDHSSHEEVLPVVENHHEKMISMPSMHMNMKSMGVQSESTKAYNKANMNMHSGMNIDFTGDVDTDFLLGMIPHHQGAVDMANIALKYGNDGGVARLSGAIIRAQEIEIDFMHRQLPVVAKNVDSDYNTSAVKAFKKVNKQMHAEMNIHFSGNADVDFVKGMIPHHQGAIDMARIVLEHGIDPNVRYFAEGVIREQTREINVMKKWLRRVNRLSVLKF